MGFELCHPAVNLIFFAAVIAGTVCFSHPAYLAAVLVCAYVYTLRYRGLRRGWTRLLWLLPAGMFALYYGSYHHFGVTVLSYNSVGNRITLEALVYGLVLGGMALGILLWLGCLHRIFTADKAVYLLGRFSPRAALFAAAALRMTPRVFRQAKKVNDARKGIGRSVGQGSLPRRIRNLLGIGSVLLTWLPEMLAGASDSMRSRGVLRKGRTAFSIYRFDGRDRGFVLWLFLCIGISAAGALLGQTRCQYDPRIFLPPTGKMWWVFWGAYVCLCLSPLAMDVITALGFSRARRGLQNPLQNPSVSDKIGFRDIPKTKQRGLS